MDEAALGALHQVIDVGLSAARRDLATSLEELAEGHAARAHLARSQEGLLDQKTRWQKHLRALIGHTLSSRELQVLRRRGEAIEARGHDLARQLEAAQGIVARASLRVEAGRRAVGELLARQRWVEEASRRGHDAREHQLALREDED